MDSYSASQAPPKRIAIPGRRFLEALRDAGIVSNEDHVRRVIIDAAVDSAVVIYVERFGDERMLAIAKPLSSLSITKVDVEDVEPSDLRAPDYQG